MPDKTTRANRKLPQHLTYANVISTLCLFLLLTGGSALAAATLGKNTVGPRQLKSKAVTTGKIAPNAVNGSKVAKESLTGADINLTQLGTVPTATSAASAGNANTVGGHPAACPAGTTLIRGLCFDSHSNSVAHSLEEAAEACAAKGGYLPAPMELYSAKGILNLGDGTEPSQQQYTDAIYSEVGHGNYRTIVLDGVEPPKEYPTNQPSAYYCVYPLVR
jgi:hypothetical protein